MTPACEYPDAAQLLAADVIRLEEQLEQSQHEAARYRDMLYIALDIAHAAVAELAKAQS